MHNINPRKFFLYLLIGSVSISALIGIGVVLLGNFGELESRILMTTMTITVTSLLGLACAANLEAGHGKILPLGGIGMSVVSAVLWIILIWREFHPHEFYFARTVMTTTILAVAFSHLSLVSMARLDRRFKWSLTGIFISIAGLVLILLGVIWFEETFETDFLLRTIGVLSIITAALTIIIPIFHKLSDNIDEGKEIDAEIRRLKERIAGLEKRKEEISSAETPEETPEEEKT